MKTTEDILKEHEETTSTQYLSMNRMILQGLMDGNYKEGLNREGNEYRKAIIELDKRFGVNKPVDRLPAALVKVDLKKLKVVEVIQ